MERRGIGMGFVVAAMAFAGGHLMAADAKPGPVAPDASSARQAVLERFDAALRSDVATLDRLLADDLDYCTFQGACESKQHYLDSVKSGALRYRSIEPTVNGVKLFADTAVVLGTVRVSATRDGIDRNLNVFWSAVLAWRDGRWQMTTWTSTLIDGAR